MARQAKTSKNLTKFYTGEEPELPIMPTKIDLIKAYNWYSYNCDNKKAKAFLEPIIGNVTETVVCSYRTVAWIARIKHRNENIVLDSNTEVFFVKGLEELKKHKTNDNDEDSGQSSHMSTRNERLIEYIACIEEEFDNVIMGNESDFSLYEWVQKHETPAIYVKGIQDFYKTILADIDAGQCDKELKKSYSPKTLRQERKFLLTLLDDADRILDNASRRRKPRKTKHKAPEKLTQNVKYLVEDTALKITSIPPEKIIGASLLYCYNTKTRKLSWFEAASDQKLSIKGTTIQNYDESKSQEIMLRKPDEFLPAFMGMGKRDSKNAIKALTTKPSSTNGRINTHMLLLKSL